jgi:hypothetical protein
MPTMNTKTTEKQLFDLMVEDYNRPPITLDEFEHWLLHRAHRPDEFPDSQACGAAWPLVLTYKRIPRGAK